MSNLSFSSPDVALVAEIPSGIATATVVPDQILTVRDAVLVSYNTYSTLAAALTAAQSIESDFDGSLLYGRIVLTSVNVSDDLQDFTVGSTATLNSEYSASAGTITYQWYKDDQIIPDAEDSSLSTSSFTSGQVGIYSCVVTATDTATARLRTLTNIFNVTETPAAPPALTSTTAFGIAAVDIHTVNNAGTGYTVTSLNVPTTGGSGTGLTVDITTDGDAILTATVNFPGEDYVDGETVTVSGDGNGDATLDITVN